MNTNKLIGKKVKGFKFEDGKYNGLSFANEMENYIGKVGIIDSYNKDNNRYRVEFNVDFNSQSWSYPAELIEQHLVEENPLNDLPIIGDGVLMEVSFTGNRWVERNVFGKSDLGFLAWHEDKSNICLWKYARPITPKTKITRKEFEQKFEIID
jgi:hypothetical protein